MRCRNAEGIHGQNGVSDTRSLLINIKGVEGEIAFCRMSGSSMDNIMDTKTANHALIDKQDCILGDGRSVDVKTTSGSSSHHLNVEAWKQRNPAKLYVSVIKNGNMFTFRGAAEAQDVFNPLFSPHVDGIVAGTKMETGYGHMLVCHRVPIEFLGPLPNPREGCIVQPPRTGAEVIKMMEELDKSVKEKLPKNLSSPSVVRAIADEIDMGVRPETMRLTEWRTVCKNGLMQRWGASDGLGLFF